MLPVTDRTQPFAKAFANQHDLLVTEIIPLYRKLASDDQDSVRLLTVADLIAIAEQLSPSEVKDLLLDPLRSSVADKSWRVRYMVANEFVGVSLHRRTEKPMLTC